MIQNRILTQTLQALPCYGCNNFIKPTAACERRAPRRDTKYNERGILSWRMRTSARSFPSTSQRTHMRGTIATPMPICTKRLMLSIVGISDGWPGL
jgi:hypothetical protein